MLSTGSRPYGLPPSQNLSVDATGNVYYRQPKVGANLRGGHLIHKLQYYLHQHLMLRGRGSKVPAVPLYRSQTLLPPFTITVMNTIVGIANGLAMWASDLGDPILWGTMVMAFLLNYISILDPRLSPKGFESNV